MSTNIPVQCCRCKNKHMHAERESVYKPKKGWSVSVCPRCGAESFYDMTPLIAWCWASGRIDVGAEMPLNSADGSGAIKIASGPKSQLMQMLNMFAERHPVYDRVVPDLDAKATQKEACDQLIHWLNDCAKKAKRIKQLNEVVFTGGV